MASKGTGGKISSAAGRILGNSGTSALQRSLAGSALAQSGTQKLTGKDMEAKASAALKNPNSAAMMIALTVVNYGYPILQLAITPDASVPIVPIGAR
jgi:ABC-type hemin transport system ATPase subunit